MNCSKKFNTDEEITNYLKLMKYQTNCEKRMNVSGEKSYVKYMINLNNNDELEEIFSKV